MKLGFALPIVGPAVSGAVGLSAFSRGLEDLGYDTLWVGDRFVQPVDMHSTYPGKEQPYPPQMTRYLDPVLLWTVAATARASEFLSLPPVHADLRPVQPGGPPIWIGGFSEAAMRRVGRSAVGWLGADGLPDNIVDALWPVARRAAQDAGRDPDALKKAIRVNVEAGTSVDSLAGKLKRFAESGADEAFVDAFALFPSLDQMLDFASQVIERTGRL